MKITKKIVCCLMAAIMLLVAVPFTVSAEPAADTTLKFGTDGKFTIMMFADIQDNEDVEETTIALMNDALDAYKPDLVVYLGDNTVAKGEENQFKAIEAITEPCISRGVPYAIVFGNHDQEQGVDKEVLLAKYQELGCLTYSDDPEVYGVGNCNLPILSSDGAKTAFNLWLIDSGSRNHDTEEGGYDFVREDQIAWYEAKAAELKEQNGGKTVPSILFQHIIVPEVYNAMYPKFPITVGDYSTYDGTTYIPVPRFSLHKGIVLEPPCPPYVTVGQLDSWVKTGDIIASIHGHDHINYFTTTYQGIDINCVPSVGCNSYSNDLVRGVGLITLDEKDTSSYEYELIHIFDMVQAENNTILAAKGAKSKIHYAFLKIVYNILDAIHGLSYGLSFGK